MKDTGSRSQINRRQFVNGMAVAVAGAALAGTSSRTSRAASPAAPGKTWGAPLGARKSPYAYPPLRSGIRGDHEGANEYAHQLAWQGRRDFGPSIEPDPYEYDLVVVGGGLSGLSAAHFFLKEKPDARVLILDNHDDFGGHATRNEFEVDGRMYLGIGGARALVRMDVNDAMQEVLEDLGIDLDFFEDQAWDYGFFERHGLKQKFYFDKETYGADRLTPGRMGFNLHMPVAPIPSRKDIWATPLNENAKRQLLAIFHANEDRTAASFVGEYGYLQSLTYEQFLKKHCGITEPQLLDWFRPMPLILGMPSETVTAAAALEVGMPGLGYTSLRLFRETRHSTIAKCFVEPIHSFPDGNASVARMLVRRLIPEVSNGQTSMTSIVTAPLDYRKLDLESSRVRLRLNSTAVKVRHDGDPRKANSVFVNYMQAGSDQQRTVKARQCILACYNAIIPHIWGEPPKEQIDALRKSYRSPMILSNFLFRNWESIRRAQVGSAYAPGHFHSVATLEGGITVGDYKASNDIDEPVILSMTGVPVGSGDPHPRNRARTGRYQILNMKFEDYEADGRRMLTGMLGPYGFDYERDIAAITVNLWAHGYAGEHNTALDPEYEEGQYPHQIGRRPFGRVAIANSDANVEPLAQAAFSQARRAVDELTR